MSRCGQQASTQLRQFCWSPLGGAGGAAWLCTCSSSARNSSSASENFISLCASIIFPSRRTAAIVRRAPQDSARPRLATVLRCLCLACAASCPKVAIAGASWKRGWPVRCWTAASPPETSQQNAAAQPCTTGTGGRQRYPARSETTANKHSALVLSDSPVCPWSDLAGTGKIIV